ncbi:unnamed protein product [Symbiodinium natans]|uniref:Uncharacterized protein n=1 Tax=Symbiodinium natans TaxID=878477 RepID=A0A812RT07_9DINO|nr:unnamed protein product [Symbiodinium natans]
MSDVDVGSLLKEISELEDSDDAEAPEVLDQLARDVPSAASSPVASSHSEIQPFTEPEAPQAPLEAFRCEAREAQPARGAALEPSDTETSSTSSTSSGSEGLGNGFRNVARSTVLSEPNGPNDLDHLTAKPPDSPDTLPQLPPSPQSPSPEAAVPALDDSESASSECSAHEPSEDSQEIERQPFSPVQQQRTCKVDKSEVLESVPDHGRAEQVDNPADYNTMTEGGSGTQEEAMLAKQEELQSKLEAAEMQVCACQYATCLAPSPPLPILTSASPASTIEDKTEHGEAQCPVPARLATGVPVQQGNRDTRANPVGGLCWRNHDNNDPPSRLSDTTGGTTQSDKPKAPQ